MRIVAGRGGLLNPFEAPRDQSAFPQLLPFHVPDACRIEPAVPADRHPNWFSAGLGALVTTLIAIGLWKGELPMWR